MDRNHWKWTSYIRYVWHILNSSAPRLLLALSLYGPHGPPSKEVFCFSEFKIQLTAAKSECARGTGPDFLCRNLVCLDFALCVLSLFYSLARQWADRWMYGWPE